MVQHRLVTPYAGEMVDVARFGHADDGVDDQVRLRFTRGAERQFLMRAVQGIAGLERHDTPPAHLAKERAEFVRRVAAGLEIIMHRLLDAGDRPAKVDRPGLIVQVIHRRMRKVIRAEYVGGLNRLVGQPFVGDRQDRKDHPLGIPQGDVLPRFNPFGKLGADIQRDRDRPQGAICHAHFGDNAVIVGLPHEPLQRMKPAVHQQFQIADLPGRQIPGRQIARLMLQLLPGLVRDVEFGDRNQIGQGHHTGLSRALGGSVARERGKIQAVAG